jgi:PAS domain S-box-containing protein
MADSAGSQMRDRVGSREGGWVLADLALTGLKAAFATTMRDLPGAQASLIFEDGQLLLHLPPAEFPIGTRFPGFPPGGHPVDGSVVQAPRDGVESSAPTLAYRQVPDFPLWVAVALPRDPVLDDWWRSPTPWLAAMALSTLGVFVLMGLALVRLDDRDRAYRIARRRQALLIAQSRLQRSLMVALPSPVVVIDARGRILQASNSFAEWVGSSPAHLKGSSPRDVLPEGPAELLLAPLDGRETTHRELIWPQVDGRTRRVQATLRPLGDAFGDRPRGTLTGDRSPRKADRPVAKVVAFLDLTDGVSLAEDLTRAKSTLRTFAQAIAEDLRVPLGDMIGRMALLERRHGEDLDKASHQAVHQAIAEGEHMRVLIDDILDYAQVALAPPPRTGVDSNAALEKALVGLAPDIKETGADIRAGILPPVRCGEAQLASLLRILVGDAIERAPADKPAKIRVDGTERDGMVTLTVTDGGGTAGDVGPETPAPRPKVGVGLALCGEILRHAGGALDRSTARDGTTVQAVHLPAAPKTTGHRPVQ